MQNNVRKKYHNSVQKITRLHTTSISGNHRVVYKIQYVK